MLKYSLIFIIFFCILSYAQDIVILYDCGTDDRNFPGETWHITKEGKYRYDQDFKDNVVSHIYIAKGYIVTLFDGYGYNGIYVTLDPGNYDLRKFNFNDKLSSLRILEDKKNLNIIPNIKVYDISKITRGKNSLYKQVKKEPPLVAHLTMEQCKSIFYEMVKMQDSDLDNHEWQGQVYYIMARRYGVTKEDITKIVIIGVERKWPMPPCPKW